MKKTKSIYGSDADGNRSISIVEGELTDTHEERYLIAKLLYNKFVDGDFVYEDLLEVNFADRDKGKTTITLDGFEFKVSIYDYLPELIVLSEEDEEFNNNPELVEWRKTYLPPLLKPKKTEKKVVKKKKNNFM